MDTPSSVTGKTANESSSDEIVAECLRQINRNHKIPDPYKVVVNKKLQKKTVNGYLVKLVLLEMYMVIYL